MAEENDRELEELDADGTAEQEDEPSDPIAERDRKIEELTDTLKRLQAEFENYKKRISKELAERSRTASEGVVYDLLAVLDTFDNALDSTGGALGAEDLLKGLESIHRQMIQTLARHGLREVRTDGRFDPFEHEALMRQETDEEEDGTILEVFHKGYLLGPKVIRTAKVKVAKAKETDHGRDAQDDEESQGSSREVNEE